MKHKFTGRACVYCGESADTADHTVGRKFFLVDQRDNLPQVPACRKCNNRKAQLENELMVLLPFGAKHPDALANLATLVPPRLAKDAKLRRKLERGLAKSGGTALPIDHKTLEELFAMIAKALAWQHWGVRLGHDCGAIASMFRNDAEPFFRRMMSSGSNRVSGDLGNGTFRYEGAQMEASPQTTIWRFWFYGGIDFDGDSDTPGPFSLAVAVTGPSALIRNLRYSSAVKDRSTRKVGRNGLCPCGSGKKHKKCHGAVAAVSAA